MKRNRLLMISLLVLISLLSGGCVRSEVRVHLNRDGSGTFENVLLVTAEALKDLSTAARQQQKDVPGKLYDEQALRALASRFGTGVSMTSVEDIDLGTHRGYRVVYAFKDINTLRIDQHPGGNIPSDKPDAGAMFEPVRFAFSRAEGKTPARLKILPPPLADVAALEQRKGTDSPADKGRVIESMYQDLHLQFVVNIEKGRVLKSNAKFRDRQRIVLHDMNVRRAFQGSDAPALLSRLARINPQTVAEAKALLQGVKGIWIDPQREISVEFR